MSKYLLEQVAAQNKLDSAELALMVRSLHSLQRDERKIVFQQGKDVLKILHQLWQEADAAEREKWLEVTAESIVEKNGDRDSLDKYALSLIGQIKVYQLVRQLCDERDIVLKSSVTQGGCAVVLIGIVLSLGLALIYSYFRL